MKTKTSRVMIVFACGLMACLLLASSGQTANRGSNRLVDMEIRQQPLELRMLVRVLRNCEENDRPVHPGIVRWASASLRRFLTGQRANFLMPYSALLICNSLRVGCWLPGESKTGGNDSTLRPTPQHQKTIEMVEILATTP